jgi:hypothetical protein
MGSVTGRDLERADCADAIRKIIEFSRDFTSGHCYPCLKIIEYLVTQMVPMDLESTSFTTKLLAAATSSEFDEPTNQFVAVVSVTLPTRFREFRRFAPQALTCL